MLRRLLTWKRALKRFGRARRGSAAVELAAVIFPFFLLTGGLAEIAMMGFAQTTLDFAVSETARQIRTGRAQMNGETETSIKQRLCANMQSFMFLNCSMNLFLDVNTFQSYAAAGNNANPIRGGVFVPNFTYQPGTGSSIVVVRAYYTWDLMTPFFEHVFANAGRQRVIVSTMMFRNEPFTPPAPSGP